MPHWNIIYKTGTVEHVRATVKRLEYHGKLMDERYVTVDIDSDVRLDIVAGDYMMYRGEKFSVRNAADVEKSARPRSHGGAFTYKGLKLTAQSWQELQDTEMTDYVGINDNRMHYTGLGTFSFYMTKVSDLGYRVQAVLDNKYGAGRWTVMIGGTALSDEYTDVEVDEGKSISISSGTSVKDALDLLWQNWSYFYSVSSGMTAGGELRHYVDLCPASGSVIPLEYGKKRTETVGGVENAAGGLMRITRKMNPNMEICTRVRAYGSERNMPYRWYNNRYEGVNEAMYIPQLMLPHMVAYYDEDGNYCDGDGRLYEENDAAVVGSVNLWEHPNDVVLENVVASERYGKRDKEIHWNSDDQGEIFPSMKGMKANDIDVESETYDGESLDRVLGFAYESADDAGSSLPADVTSGKVNFTVTVPNPGFNPTAQNTSENVELVMQSGMCQARAFTIVKSEAVESNGEVVAYVLTCAKIIDEEIDQVFPNSPSFEIAAGDYYVYTGLEYNGDYTAGSWLDIYIRAAEMRLLKAAAMWLRQHSAEDYVYDVVLDNVFMKTEPNVASNLTEGREVLITDNSVGTDKAEVIESVTITEGKEAIPTYEITFLRRDESESLGDRVKGLVGQSISASSDIAKMNDSLYKKVNKAGFHSLFDPLDKDFKVLDINGDLSALKYIRANVDFFSTGGVSALGVGASGGGGGASALAELTDVTIQSPQNGQYLSYNSTTGKWENVTGGGGGGGASLADMWASLTGNTDSYANRKINAGHIPDLSGTYQTVISDLATIRTRANWGREAYLWGDHAQAGYLTSSDISDMATKTWVNQQGFVTSSGVTSVGLSVPTGFTVDDSPVTSSGTLALGIASGYFMPTTTQRTTWNNKQDAISDLSTIRSNASHGETAYGWGNHADAGYMLLTEGLRFYAQGPYVAARFSTKTRGYDETRARKAQGDGYIEWWSSLPEGNPDNAESGYLNHEMGWIRAKGNITIGTGTSDTTHYLQIGGGKLCWDNTNKALYVQQADGTAAHFYATGGVSALGMGVSGTASLNTLKTVTLTVTDSITTGSNGILISDPDGDGVIYSSGGTLTLRCDEGILANNELTVNGALYMLGNDILNAGGVHGTSLHSSGMVYLNQELAALAYNKNTGQLILRTRTSTSGAWTDHIISMN